MNRFWIAFISCFSVVQTVNAEITWSGTAIIRDSNASHMIDKNHIYVKGIAVERYKSEDGRLIASVEGQGDTVEKALADFETQTETLKAFYQEQGVSYQDFTQLDFGVNKSSYNWGATDQKPIYKDIFTVSYTGALTFTDYDAAGALLQKLVANGFSEVEMVPSELSEEKVDRSALRKRAFEDARAKAEILANAAGQKLGKPLVISEEEIYPPVDTGNYGNLAPPMQVVPVSNGLQVFEPTVSEKEEIYVLFAIEPSQ